MLDKSELETITLARTMRTKLGGVKLMVDGQYFGETRILYLLCSSAIERALANLSDEEEIGGA